MALGATVFKADLQIADMDRGYYQSHALVLARHPSETDERMMVRLLAFALNASETLAFGKGLSSDDEPDLCDRDFTGRIARWIDVGLPAEKDLRKACARADEVTLYAYGGRSVTVWWRQNSEALKRCRNLRVIELPVQATQTMAAWARRSMRIHCTIQDALIWLSDGDASLQIQPIALQAPEA